jgi:hypothetical protein
MSSQKACAAFGSNCDPEYFLGDRLLDGDRVAERTLSHHRDERGTHGDDPGADRDLLAGECGIARLPTL